MNVTQMPESSTGAAAGGVQVRGSRSDTLSTARPHRDWHCDWRSRYCMVTVTRGPTGCRAGGRNLKPALLRQPAPESCPGTLTLDMTSSKVFL